MTPPTWCSGSAPVNTVVAFNSSEVLISSTMSWKELAHRIDSCRASRSTSGCDCEIPAYNPTSRFYLLYDYHAYFQHGTFQSAYPNNMVCLIDKGDLDVYLYNTGIPPCLYLAIIHLTGSPMWVNYPIEIHVVPLWPVCPLECWSCDGNAS